MRSFTLHRRRWARLVAVCGIAGILTFPTAIASSAAAAQTPCPPATEEEGDPPGEIPWHQQRMNPGSVWPLTRGEGITVAVLDSGVAAGHELLQGQVLEGRDFGALADHNGQCDAYYHGTLAAGVIAGRDDLDGVTPHGIAPEAKILPGRVTFEGDGEELTANLPEAIDWAVDQDVDIINLSLASPPNADLQAAVENAVENDVVLVAAIGNVIENEDGDLQEQATALAAYEGVIAVAGVDRQSARVQSSQEAGFLDVAAPGTDIWGPMPNGGYAVDEGTSFATPIVSGVAALLRSYYPDMSAEQVAARIIATADHPPQGHNNQVGYGVVNPYRAVTAVLGTRPNLPADGLALAAPEPDPLASARRIAAWAALAGVVITVLLLLAPAAIRRGRERGWRPARMT